jgi:hypothetical protein
MILIFVSHSKHDKGIVNNFVKAFSRVGLTPKLIELEDLDNKYAGYEISNTILNESNGVVVLLGKSLQFLPTSTRQYTHNWVNFEVGMVMERVIVNNYWSFISMKMTSLSQLRW